MTHAAGTTARERAAVGCANHAEFAAHLRQAIADYYADTAPLADCCDSLAALPEPAGGGPSDVRAALVRRVRTNAEWLGMRVASLVLLASALLRWPVQLGPSAR